MLRVLLALAIVAIAAPPWAPAALAQGTVRSERVQFPKDQSTKTIKGTLKGAAAVHYLVTAQAGQTLTIALATNNPSNHFNVTAPGTKEAMFVGSALGNEFNAKLPLGGDYVLRVYLADEAARKNESASYTLTVEMKP